MRHSIRSLFLLTALGMTLGVPSMAHAQDDPFADDDDFEFEGEEEAEDDDSQRLEEDDDLDSVDEQEQQDEGLDDFTDPLDDEESMDLLGEEPDAALPISGDSAAIYRETQNNVKNAGLDEELQTWEQYLADYPNTPFRERISKRIGELEAAMYETRIGEGGQQIDALDTEFHFANALQLESIDPRTRFQIGAEWGLPAYINLALDFEYAIARTFSVHMAARRRYTGYSFEPGVRWAIVKSTRTKTLVTFIGDTHFNANPAFVGFRPQLAFGKRFGEKLDAQIQGGIDLEARETTPIRIVGGMSATYAASDIVKVFVETGWHMKQLTRDGGSYRFNVLTFGMKFLPKNDDNGQPSEDVDVNLGTTVPWNANYWSYHYGSVMTQANVYL